MSKKKLYILSFAVLTITLFVGWKKLTAQYGKQKVSYIPAQKECFNGEGSRPYKYCIYKSSAEPVNGNVAYLLHGRSQNEQYWSNDTVYTTQIQKYWQSKKISPPTIVTVSFGNFWMLIPKGQKEGSGLLEVFLNEVMPEVEKRTGPPKERIVFGESMGGINSLELVFKTTGLFQKAAVLCPVITEQTPFSTLAEIKTFLTDTGAEPTLIFSVLRLSQTFFANVNEWNNFSPPVIVEKAEFAKDFKMYLSCGLYDKYGNYATTEKLAERLKAKGVDLIWRPLYGEHCAVDIVSIADFLVQ